MLNKVIMIARLCQDPELRYTPQGDAVANLRLASNRSYKPKDSKEYKDEVTYITAVIWGKRAENCNEHLKKGSAVFVEGRLKSESWEKDGVKQYAIKIQVEEIQFMDKISEGTSEKAEENPGD